MTYEYNGHTKLGIIEYGESGVEVVATNAANPPKSIYVRLPTSERREAAQQIAGPDYRVVPRDLTVGDLARIARDAGVKLDMDLQESEPTDSETVTVSWHDTVLIGPAIHNAKMLADSEDGGGITISEGGEALAHLPLPKRRGTRLNLARLVTPDGWSIVPSESATNAAAMQEDLARILDALGLSTASRPYSPHECVQRDVLPAIERLKYARDGAYEKGYSAGVQWGMSAARKPDRPEPVDPASVKVGDVVEVEADDSELLIRGTVASVGTTHWPIGLHMPNSMGVVLWPDIPDEYMVRILHAAEPEPDPAAVDRLHDAICAVSGLGTDDALPMARALIRDHGVHMEVRDG